MSECFRSAAEVFHKKKSKKRSTEQLHLSSDMYTWLFKLLLIVANLIIRNKD